MSKKKRFGISEALTRGLSDTIKVVENNPGVFRNIVLPLSRIELDPDNPRQLTISVRDVETGLKSDDPLYIQKQRELEKIKELGHTIKTNGIINPIVVYKQSEKYRIVTGERRYLASLHIGKQDIEARVFNEKPKGFDLKLIQWVENTAREDLTLFERINNVKEILNEYQKQHHIEEVSATHLKNITGLSLSQTSYYLAAINAPSDVQSEITNGNIRNLDKAALLSGIHSTELRQHVLQACLQGSSLKELRNLVNQKNPSKPKPENIEKRGRKSTKINMGSTHNLNVIRFIIETLLQHQKLKKFQSEFLSISWNDSQEINKVFRRMIHLLEMDAS